jgi:FkbM family methyltransferase
MLNEFLIKIQQDGLRIHTVYDIGAHKGWWTVQMKQGPLPRADFYMFEANPSFEPWLEQMDVPYHIGVLSDCARDVNFYSINGSGDSYYLENTQYYESDQFQIVPAISLDSVIQSSNLPVPNFIKLDTQGSELDILRGAERILPKVDLVYMECPIVCYNQGAPTIQDYLNYMQSQNFMPIDLLEIHRGDHTLLQVDIMFINSATRAQLYGHSTALKC